MPSANGTRMASACPPPIPFPAQNPPCRQDVCKPSRQKSHVPSDQAKGAMTKSPFFQRGHLATGLFHHSDEFVAHRGTTGRGRHVVVRVCRSEPQTHALTTRTIASVGCCSAGSGHGSRLERSPGAVHDGCSHGVPSCFWCRGRFEVDVSAWTGPTAISQRRASRARECLLFQVTAGRTSLGLLRSSNVNCMDNRAEIREFLSSRRARITPEQAGLPAYGGNRRVKGLRREEVALLAGVSIDYYVRMERGNLAGASDSVLESLSRALQLDEAETAHLYDLAKAASAGAPSRKRPAPKGVSPAIQQITRRHHRRAGVGYVMPGTTCWRANRMARALYSPVLADPRRPANNAGSCTWTRHRRTSSWIGSARQTTSPRCSAREAGRNPHDKAFDRAYRRTCHSQ